MKAISIFGPNDIRFIEVEKPEAGPGDVLARVAFSGICGTDLSILGGKMKYIEDGLIKYPVRIGHEWSGIVVEVGKDVTKVKPGDKVVSDPGVTCGKCPSCKEGNYSGCMDVSSLGTINCWDGSFAQYILIPERHVFKLSDKVRLEEAALCEPAAIALGGVKSSNVSRGDTVLIIGTGPIGLAAVSLAKYKEAKKVILCGRKDFKLIIGRTMGADVLVNSTKEDLKTIVMRETAGKGADIVIDTAGNVDTANQILDCVKIKGTIVLIGFYEDEVKSFDIDRIVTKCLQINGVWGDYGLVGEIAELLAAHEINLKPMITHILPFDKAIHAMKTANEKSDTKIKTLIEIANDFNA